MRSEVRCEARKRSRPGEETGIGTCFRITSGTDGKPSTPKNVPIPHRPVNAYVRRRRVSVRKHPLLVLEFGIHHERGFQVQLLDPRVIEFQVDLRVLSIQVVGAQGRIGGHFHVQVV